MTKEIDQSAEPDESEAEREQRYRDSAQLSIAILRQQVEPLLRAIAADYSGEIVASLQPEQEDCDEVFRGEAVELAKAVFPALWHGGAQIEYPEEGQSQLKIEIAPAGMLAEENEMSYYFPAGYRALTKWLNPHSVWLCWEYLYPGDAHGLRFDGLVFCRGRWVWFPKPYRQLAALEL